MSRFPGILDHNGVPFSRGPNHMAATRLQPFAEDPRYLADGFAVPRSLTFNALIGSSRAYYADRWDEALRHGRQDAIRMRFETQLMALLQERYLAVATLPWHLEIPNEKDARQVQVRDMMTEAIKAGKRLTTMIYCLLEAIWYGRMAVQTSWVNRDVRGRKVYSVRRWTPENGDIIGHLKDGTPYIGIHPSDYGRFHDSETTTTTNGMRALVLRGTWRNIFLIHTHIPESPDYFDAEQAEALFGLGVRSRVFYYQYLKTNWLAEVSHFVQRVGLGVNLWYYDAGNPQALEKVQQASREYGDKLNILIPKWPDQRGGQPGMERVEVPTQGADLLIKLMEHINDIQERFVVGQSMSSGRDNKDGLGGTGRAQFAQDTKDQVRNFDAVNLAETMTGDQDDPGLCWLIQRFSFTDTLPGWPNGFQVRFKFDLEDSKSKEKLEAIKTVVDLGVDVKADEARGAAGCSKPADGDEVIQGKQQQQPGMMPGGGGLPGMPGAPGMGVVPQNGQANGQARPGNPAVASQEPPKNGQPPSNRLANLNGAKPAAPKPQQFSRSHPHGDDDLPENPDPIDETLWRWCLDALPYYGPEDRKELPKVVGRIDGCKVVLVDGDAVKRQHEMDFVEGANGYRFDFIPKDEIWLDANLASHDWKYVLYHEAFEVKLMKGGVSYDKAHPRANGVEWQLRERDAVAVGRSPTTYERTPVRDQLAAQDDLASALAAMAFVEIPDVELTVGQ